MGDKKSIHINKVNKMHKGGGAFGLHFLGFIGALVYYIHFHSGTFWLVILAFLKALIWPAFVVYHLLLLFKL